MMKQNRKYIILTDANFANEVLASQLPVLVEFGADWCGTCHILAPIVDELAAKFEGKLKIGKLDIDANKQVAAEYCVHRLPTLLFFNDGKLIDHIIGVAPRTSIIEKIGLILN